MACVRCTDRGCVPGGLAFLRSDISRRYVYLVRRLGFLLTTALRPTVSVMKKKYEKELENE